jgi:dCTP deaminase
MILTGTEIQAARARGEIVIEPFDEAQLGPNSYDFRLGDRARWYTEPLLDARGANPTESARITEDGLLVTPDRLILCNTHETMGSDRFVPIIRGRSSTGRLGLFIDITADLIDLGSVNQWTLQLHAVMPVRIYPGMLIGQVTFWRVQGPIRLYRGKYRDRESPVESLIHLPNPSEAT